MSSARPVDFDGEGQYEAADVIPSDDGTFLATLIEDDSIAHQVRADRVIVGGGLPEEGIDIRHAPGSGRHHYGKVDLCVNHYGDTVTVWLAP